jgi:hypothetical protein
LIIPASLFLLFVFLCIYLLTSTYILNSSVDCSRLFVLLSASLFYLHTERYILIQPKHNTQPHMILFIAMTEPDPAKTHPPQRCRHPHRQTAATRLLPQMLLLRCNQAAASAATTAPSRHRHRQTAATTLLLPTAPSRHRSAATTTTAKLLQTLCCRRQAAAAIALSRC